MSTAPWEDEGANTDEEYLMGAKWYRWYRSVDWPMIVRQRRNVPSFSVSHFNPKLKINDFGGRDYTFISSGDTNATLRPARRHPFVEEEDKEKMIHRGVEVRVAEGRTVGTLAIRFDPKKVEKDQAEFLRLGRWNSVMRRYELVWPSGVDLEVGYIYGIIAVSGTYGPVLISPYITEPSGNWFNLGPVNRSGAMIAVSVDPTDYDTLYAASQSGGVWRMTGAKTIGSGAQMIAWTPLTDQMPSLNIDAMATSGTSLLYVDDSGTLYSSPLNNPTLWTPLASRKFSGARKILAVGSTIYVADSRGVWMTPDNGATWKSNPGNQTLYDGDINDLGYDPSSQVFYVGVRYVGVVKTDDQFEHATLVLPWSASNYSSSSMIKIAIGAQGNDATRTVLAKLGGYLFVSHSGGLPSYVSPANTGSWSAFGPPSGSPWDYGYGYDRWCHVVAVDPRDDSKLFVGSLGLWNATDGQNFHLSIPGVESSISHEDQHELKFDPNMSLWYIANDGGIWSSPDGSVWNGLNDGLVTLWFWLNSGGVENGQKSVLALGAANHQGIGGSEDVYSESWKEVDGHNWEAGDVLPDTNPTRAGTWYYLQTPLVRRRFPLTGTSEDWVNIATSFNSTCLASDPRPTSTTLLVGTDVGTLMRALDGASSDAPTWTLETGIALASGDRIASIAFGASNSGLVYAISAQGKVFMKADANSGVPWTPMGSWSPPATPVNQIVTSSRSDSLLFAIAGSAVIGRSSDWGKTWNTLPANGIPTVSPALMSICTMPTSILANSPARPPETLINALFVASIAGVFASFDDGETWYSFSTGLPNVGIGRIMLVWPVLYATTSGRGLWATLVTPGYWSGLPIIPSPIYPLPTPVGLF